MYLFNQFVPTFAQKKMALFRLVYFFSLVLVTSDAWSQRTAQKHPLRKRKVRDSRIAPRLGLFDNLKNPFEGVKNPLDGISSPFEEATALGKGMTVVRLQVALEARDRSSSSILGTISSKAASCYPESPRSLAQLVSEVCLALLRKEADWVAASSESKVFQGLDQTAAEDKAESHYNRMLTKELSKFEKEYVPAPGTPADGAKATLVVVSLLAAVRGDQTDLGFVTSVNDLKRALQLLASNVVLERGELLVAGEVLWTPSEAEEVLTRSDMLLDYPELVDL